MYNSKPCKHSQYPYNDTEHNKTIQKTCATSEDSDQTGQSDQSSLSVWKRFRFLSTLKRT